jgi:hypothetical protein
MIVVLHIRNSLLMSKSYRAVSGIGEMLAVVSWEYDLLGSESRRTVIQSSSPTRTPRK